MCVCSYTKFVIFAFRGNIRPLKTFEPLPVRPRQYILSGPNPISFGWCSTGRNAVEERLPDPLRGTSESDEFGSGRVK